jgi:copper transport protein
VSALRAAAAAAAVVALCLPGAALGHARLDRSSPGFRERLPSAPQAVVLRFDQAVEPVGASIEVRAADGTLVSRGTHVEGSRRALRSPLRPVPRGAYTVRWQALSFDGHVLSGVYTFGVGTDAPPPTEAFGAGGPTRAEDAVRWAYFLALALLAGGLGFRLIVARGSLPPAAERRFYVLTGLAAVAVLDLGVAAFLLRADGVLGLPFERLLGADLTPIAEGTRFGLAFIATTLGFAVVAALVYLAWLTGRAAVLWPAFVLAVALAAGTSLSGHSGSDGPWSVFADWVHLTAALLWLGGLVTLAFVVWPAAPGLRRRVFLRFSRLASALVALVLGAGIYLSVARLPAVADLWTTSYGRVLLVKLALVSLALLWGAFHHFVVRPALDRPSAEGVVARLPRSLAGESTVGMAILLAAAVLVGTTPPAPG